MKKYVSPSPIKTSTPHHRSVQQKTPPKHINLTNPRINTSKSPIASKSSNYTPKTIKSNAEKQQNEVKKGANKGTEEQFKTKVCCPNCHFLFQITNQLAIENYKVNRLKNLSRQISQQISTSSFDYADIFKKQSLFIDVERPSETKNEQKTKTKPTPTIKRSEIQQEKTKIRNKLQSGKETPHKSTTPKKIENKTPKKIQNKKVSSKTPSKTNKASHNSSVCNEGSIKEKQKSINEIELQTIEQKQIVAWNPQLEKIIRAMNIMYLTSRDLSCLGELISQHEKNILPSYVKCLLNEKESENIKYF